MRDDRDNLIVDLSFRFALKLIKYVEVLGASKKYVIANQLLKAGTSVGANVREAQNAESRLDFLHKLKLAAKELDETQYWLSLCRESFNHLLCEELIEDSKVLTRVLSKIISKTKNPN